MELIQKQIKELEDNIIKEITRIGQVKNDVIEDLIDLMQQLRQSRCRGLQQHIKSQLIKLKNELFPQWQTMFLQLQKAIKQNISIEDIEKLANQLKDQTSNFLQLVTQTIQRTNNQIGWAYMSINLSKIHSKLKDLKQTFKNNIANISNLISLISALKRKQQQQKQQQTHKVFEVMNRLIGKTPSIIFKPSRQQDFLYHVALQNFIEYQRQISQKEMKLQLNKLEKKMDKMFENKVNSEKEVLNRKEVKDKQLQLQRMRSNMNQQSIRNQQQVARLSLQLSSKDQTIKQLLTSIKQLQTSQQIQSQQTNSIISQQQTTIQSQHQQVNFQSQKLQTQSQELMTLSQQLGLVKKQLQETISRNSQQTTKIIQENEAMKKKLNEKDDEIQRLNEEVSFLGLTTKTQPQSSPSTQLLQKILKELQHMKNDQIATITKKNHELQSQKLLLQAKLKQHQRLISKDSEHNLQNKSDANIKQLKQDIVRQLDKLSEMQDSTEKYDQVVSQLKKKIRQLQDKIDLQQKMISQLQQSLKQCQTQSLKTRKTHQLQLKRSSLQYQDQVQKATQLQNRLQQKQRQYQTLRQQLSLKSKQVINLTIQNQRLQNQINEAA